MTGLLDRLHRECGLDVPVSDVTDHSEKVETFTGYTTGLESRWLRYRDRGPACIL